MAGFPPNVHAQRRPGPHRNGTAVGRRAWHRRICLHGLAALGFIATTLLPWAVEASCVQPGQWFAARAAVKPLPHAALLEDLSRRRVVLLGEEHDDAQHHAWQLHTLAALHALRPGMVIGFEGFPRRVQPVLDRWIAGRLTEAEFLREVDWDHIWGIDAKLYLPLFHFARMHGIALRALNVDRSLVRQVGQVGWSAIPPESREGITDPEPATDAYLRKLHPTYLAHAHTKDKGDLDDPEFRRFVDSMLLWDRAMAQALANAAESPGNPLVVGIVGRGHLEHFHGIPRQLSGLGIDDAGVLLPWDVGADCSAPPAGIADAVFGLQAKAMQATGPRLGVELAPADEGAGARIHRVMTASVAASAGLRDGDVIRHIAGVKVDGVDTVIAAVRRQAPGTWLPLTVWRDGQLIELVAKFPPQQ